MSRVLVIGSGMAGTAAALAARRSGATVTVVAAGTGATAFSSGVIWPGALGEVEGFEPVGGTALCNVLGEQVAVSLATFQQARGALNDGKRVGIVGLRAAPQLLDAGWVADGLRRSTVRAEAVELDLHLTGAEVLRTPFDWATALGAPEERRRWVDALGRLPDRFDLLLLPACIGWEPAVLEGLRRATGRELGELVPTAPSVPGLRLHRALAARRAAAGCAERLDSVTSLTPGRARLGSGEDLAFDGAVLATGRFLGGGLSGQDGPGDGLHESLLGLRLAMGSAPAPTSETDLQPLAGDRPGMATPLFELGVTVDGHQRPLTSQGAPLDWLFAAGALLAGVDRGLGFAWQSGLAAGNAAAAVTGTQRSAVA